MEKQREALIYKASCFLRLQNVYNIFSFASQTSFLAQLPIQL